MVKMINEMDCVPHGFTEYRSSNIARKGDLIKFIELKWNEEVGREDKYLNEGGEFMEIKNGVLFYKDSSQQKQFIALFNLTKLYVAKKIKN